MLRSGSIIRLYEHLQNSLEAGLPLTASWESAPEPARRMTEGVVRALNSGLPVEESLEGARRALPAFDRRMLGAAAATSRFPDTLGRLSRMHQRKLQVRRALAMALGYPLILAHMAAFLFPILSALDLEEGGFQWEASTYLASAIGALLILWSGIGIFWVILAHPHPHFRSMRSWLPVVGKFHRHRSLADFCFGLGMLLDAQVPVAEAWRQAGVLSGNVRLERATRAIARRIEQGEAPGHILGEYDVFPAFVTASFQNAEATGKIVETLEKQATALSRMAENSLKLLWIVLPILAVLLAAVLIAYHVISFFARYLDLLERI